MNVLEHSLRNISIYEPKRASERERNTDFFYPAPASAVLASSSLPPSSLEMLLQLETPKPSQPATPLPGVLLL